MESKIYQTESAEEMQKIAESFSGEILQLKKNVVGLYGELGSGKTTFVQGLANALGIKERVNSPTFVIEKIYALDSNKKFSRLIHIDAYRLENSNELLSIGWQKIISDPRNLILIEWPERVKEIMPDHIKIYFEHGESEFSRKIEIVF